MRKLFAVFGNPILHSKSPILFNSVFEKTHVDAFYTRIHAESCQDVIQSIRKLNIIGANITTPFKEEIIPLLDELSTDAEQIGAVNTILNDNGHIKGFNTDFVGVVKAIVEFGIDIFGKRCLVLGAGGASKATVYGLVNAGAEVIIANRTLSKAQEISNHFGCNVISLDEINDLNGVDVIVSTLLPNVSLPNIHWDKNVKLFIDANYRKSILSEEVQNAGIKVIRGDRWLIHQAIAAFNIYTGFEPQVELLNAAFNLKLDYHNAKIKAINIGNDQLLPSENYDMLVVTNSIDQSQIKKVIDEELHKAINS